MSSELAFSPGEVIAILEHMQAPHDYDPIDEAEAVLGAVSATFTAQDARRLVGITRRQAQWLLEIAKGNRLATGGAKRAIRRRCQALRHLDQLLAAAAQMPA